MAVVYNIVPNLPDILAGSYVYYKLKLLKMNYVRQQLLLNEHFAIQLCLKCFKTILIKIVRV